MRNKNIAHQALTRCCLAALLSGSALASQACTQNDLTGMWFVSGLSTVTFDAVNHSEASFTTYCKLNVNSAGVFNKATSTCDSSAGKTAIAGTMKLAGKSCNVKAFPMTVFSNGVQVFTFTVDHLALDRSKSTFTATGNKDSATTGMAQFIWQGVKQ